MNFWTNTSEGTAKPPVLSVRDAFARATFTRAIFTRAIFTLAACLLALGAWPQPAHAAKPSKEELRTFKELVKQGSELRDEGKSWAALDRFQEARAILDHPKLTFNIGKLHQQTGACERAREAYTDVLKASKLPDELRTEVVTQLESVEDCTSFGTLILTCAPTQAKVGIDAKSLSCPVRQKVRPGDLQIEVTAPGHTSETIEASIEPGERFERDVELRPAEVANAVTPPEQTSEASSWMKYTAYGSIGVGAALLVGGIASDYGAQSRAEEFVAANNSGDRGRAQTLKSEADSAQVRTVVLYSVGAVLVGGGITLWALDAQQEGEDAAVVRTQIGWSPQGASVSGVLSW